MAIDSSKRKTWYTVVAATLLISVASFAVYSNSRASSLEMNLTNKAAVVAPWRAAAPRISLEHRQFSKEPTQNPAQILNLEVVEPSQTKTVWL